MPTGYFVKVPCQLGLTLFDALKQASIPIPGTCGNKTPENFYSLFKKPVESSVTPLTCQKCMCKVESPWFEKIPLNNWEKEFLQTNIHKLPYGENRRFACTFKLEPWMDEMIIDIRTELKRNRLSNEEMNLMLMAGDEENC